MKKHTLRAFHLIELVIVFFAIFIFIMANPKTLNYLATTISDRYNLTYKSIDGNILTNIHIKDIRFENKPLASDANIDFNLLKLLLLQLDINKIEFSKVDINSLKYFINSFDNNKSNNTTTKKDIKLPIVLNIHNIVLDILPYKKEDVEIKNLKIDIKKFFIGSNIDIDDVKVDMKSNYFNLHYTGSYKNYSLFIDDMNITRLNIEKTLLLKDIIKSDSESNNTLIKSIDIKKAFLNIKPFKKGKYKVDTLNLFVKNLSSKNMKQFDADNIKIVAKTNIWKLHSNGFIRNSSLISKVKVDLDNKYFKKFIPFINYKRLNPINVKLKVDKDRLLGDVNASFKRVLTKDLDKKLLLNIDKLSTHAELDFKSLYFHLNSDINLSTKYSKNIKIKGDFYFDKKNSITYQGYIDFKNFQQIDKRLKKLLNNSHITFNGDKKGIKAFLKSDFLSGKYISKNYMTPTIKISSKSFLAKDLDKNLSKKLDKLKLHFLLKSVLNYKNLKNTDIKYQINSNLVDITGIYSIKAKKSTFRVDLSKKSILHDIDKKIKTKTIFPIDSIVNFDNKIDIVAKNEDITIKAIYDNDLNLTATTKDSKLNIYKKDKDIVYSLDTLSLKNLLDNIKKYYKLSSSINIDAQLKLQGIYNQKNEAIFKVNARWFLYEYEKYKYLFLENTTLSASFKDNFLTIDRYNTNAYLLDRYRRIFSDTISSVEFLDDSANLNITLNNDIKISGQISDTTSLKIKSNYYHLNEPEANLFMNINLRYLSSSYKSSLKGYIYLLKGTLKYKPKNSHTVNDEDIIFVNKQKSKKTIKKNLDISVNIMTKNKIKYILDKNRVDFVSDITLFKEKKDDLKVFGYVKIKDGVYYSDEKRFTLGTGEILFSGEMLNPYLNLKAYYKKNPYSITIHIGGKLDSPILNFSSTPYLTQNDILSILLFNTKASSLTNSDSSTNPALSLFGSSFAKGIADSLGVKLDRIELSTTKDGGIGFELEKKINNKITIIYQNDLVQTIKIRYKNSPKVETNLIFSPESSGIDIIYKNEK